GAEPSSSGGGPSLLDLLRPIVEQLTGELFTRILVNLLQGVVTALLKVVSAVMGSALNFVTQTPAGATYGSPTVQALWGAMRAVANLGLVLVVAWGGFNLIAAGQTGSPYHAAMELVPRVACGALLVNTSLGWARLWSSTFVGTVFTQFVQVLALKLGGSLMTDLAPQSADAAVLALFLGVAVMVLTLKIPALMRGQLGDGLGFARYYAYRQGA